MAVRAGRTRSSLVRAKTIFSSSGGSCERQCSHISRDMPTLEDFSCAICLEMLHKPAVNHCGHAFCFWCFHHAMGGLHSSQCPLCRAEFRHFAACCKPLHAYLLTTFPGVAQERDAHTKEQERDVEHAESPDLEIADGDGDPLVGFRCAGCKEVAAPPAVLSCGHVVCATRSGGWPRCPEVGCVGKSPGGSNSTCGLIESILRASLPAADYEEARARGCRYEAAAAAVAPAQPAAASAAAATDDDRALTFDSPERAVGLRVEVHSLSGATAQQLNGQCEHSGQGSHPCAPCWSALLITSACLAFRLMPSRPLKASGCL